MSDLLDRVLDAHGGLDRWRTRSRLSFTGSAGGILPWPRPDFLARTGAVLDTREQRATLHPFGSPERRAVFTPGHVEIQDATGLVLAAQDEPRRSFDDHPADARWSELQAAYFAGYAFWMYLTVPFLLVRDDIAVQETEPWRENGETWRRLRVEFGPSLATHNAVQTLYFGPDHLLRRHDYSPDVLGNPLTAHYTTDYRSFDGFAFPTRRYVLRRHNDNTTSGDTLITLDLDSVEVS